MIIFNIHQKIGTVMFTQTRICNDFYLLGCFFFIFTETSSNTTGYRSNASFKGKMQKTYAGDK